MKWTVMEESNDTTALDALSFTLERILWNALAISWIMENVNIGTWLIVYVQTCEGDITLFRFVRYVILTNVTVANKFVSFVLGNKMRILPTMHRVSPSISVKLIKILMTAGQQDRDREVKWCGFRKRPSRKAIDIDGLSNRLPIN